MLKKIINATLVSLLSIFKIYAMERASSFSEEDKSPRKRLRVEGQRYPSEVKARHEEMMRCLVEDRTAAVYHPRFTSSCYDPADGITKKDPEGNTYLHHAAALGLKNTLAFFVSLGADVNATNTKGYTPLQLAASRGRTAMALYLLKNGANPLLKEAAAETTTCIRVPAKYEVLRMLLEKAGKVYSISQKIREYREYKYAENVEKKDLSKLLKDIKKEIRKAKEHLNLIADAEQDTLLHDAVEMNEPEIVEALIKNGADVNAINKKGRTPLFYVDPYDPGIMATGKGEITFKPCRRKTECRKRCIDLLVNAGADPDVVDNEGYTTLLYIAKEYERRNKLLEGCENAAVRKEVELEIHIILGMINTFLNMFADVTITSPQGKTVYDYTEPYRKPSPEVPLWL